MLATTRSTAALSRSRQSVALIANRAFTMLEIMVVLAILGMLVGVLAVNVARNLESGAEDTARIFVSATLKAPLTAYRIDMGDYPSTAEGLAALVSRPTGQAGRWRGPYLESAQLPVDPWQQPYVYRYPGTHNPASYDLFSKGQDKVADSEDDVGNW